MKRVFYSVLLLFLAWGVSGCGIFSFEPEIPTSKLKIEDIQSNLRLGMTYEQLLSLVKVAPEILEKGTAKFNLENGELWVRLSGDEKQPEEVLFWGTVIKLGDGSTIKKTSKEQSLAMMLNNPICIDIDITTSFAGKNRTGKCYYEQYGPGNILVDASEKGDDSKKVSLIYVNGRFVLLKGNVPPGSEFKYLAGYMSNLQLMQHLIAKGMKEATPVENGRRNFTFEDKKEPFVLQILNKKVVYPAPWEVDGFVEPRKDENGFDFDINFKVTWQSEAEQKIQYTNFKGTFRQEKKNFGENLNMADWKQFEMITPGTLAPVSIPKKDFIDLR